MLPCGSKLQSALTLLLPFWWQVPCCRFHIHFIKSDTATPTELNTPVIIPISKSLVLGFSSRGYTTVEVQPCAARPLWTNSCTKTRQLYPQRFADRGRSKSTSVCRFAFVTFPFTESSCSFPLTPCFLFQRTGPSVHNNAGNLTLFSASGQRAPRPL